MKESKASKRDTKKEKPSVIPLAEDEWRKSIKKGCRRVLGLLESGQIDQAKEILRSQTRFMPVNNEEVRRPGAKAQNSVVSSCIPWNKGQIVGQKPPLQSRHVWSIRQNLKNQAAVRDLALFNLAIDSKLLGHEVVRLKVADVAPTGEIVDQVAWARKGKKTVHFEIGEESRRAIADHLKHGKHEQEDYLFGGRGGANLTGRQFARLVSQWVADIGLDPLIYGTHSLRRTKAMLIYQQTGNLRAVQAMLGHKKAETTVAYLGIGESEEGLEFAARAGI